MSQFKVVPTTHGTVIGSTRPLDLTRIATKEYNPQSACGLGQSAAESSADCRWAVTMTKIRIRRVVARTRWQLVTFYGKSGKLI
jgi:hypothetical protein